MAIQGADMGTLRIYDPARGTMEIAAHIGLPKRISRITVWCPLAMLPAAWRWSGAAR